MTRAMHPAEATVLTETSLSISARWDRFGPTTHQFRLQGCKLCRSHAVAVAGPPVRYAGRCGNEPQSAARAGVRLAVHQFLQAGSISRRRSAQFRIRTVRAHRLIRMVLLHPSSAL